MRWYGVLGAVLVLVGAVWLLQGIGVLQGSVMTGQALWVIVGAISLVLGVGLVYTAVPKSHAPTRS